LQCLSVLLLPALAPDHTLAATWPRVPRERPTDPSSAYLPINGAPPLRFQEVAPPSPDLVMRPPAAAPPSPPMTVAESSVALENAAAARSTSIRESSEASHTAAPATPQSSPSDSKTASPILPDDLRPQVHPEDFLPFFQLSGSAGQPGDVTVIVPAARTAPPPGNLPVSSATYTQTLK
jgi:hypothetical protein